MTSLCNPLEFPLNVSAETEIKLLFICKSQRLWLTSRLAKLEPSGSSEPSDLRLSSACILYRRKIRLIECNAKCRYLKNWPVTGLCGRCFICLVLSCLPFTLKGHGNEVKFLGFLQKLVPHRSLTLPFEPFQFWLRIRGDIRNRKTTPRVGELAFECLKEKLASRRVGGSPTWLVGESLTPRLGDSESCRLPDSASRGVSMESLFKFFKIYHRITAF